MMISSLLRSYRLVPRGEAGLVCDEDGLALGALDLARVGLGAGGERRCEMRSLAEIDQILRAAYGPLPDGTAPRVYRGLLRAAAAIEAGDLGLAGIEAVKLQLAELKPEAVTKLAGIADLEKRGEAWETEPRIPAGQAGGGQWTTADGAATPAGIGREQPASRPSPTGASEVAVDAPVSSDARSADDGLLIPVSTATTADGFWAPGEVALPSGVARLGRAGLLGLGAALLDELDAYGARQQISNAIARFGLDPDRPADVMAASAYVWSSYMLPVMTKAPFSGPALDSASQAVMRFVMVNPGALLAMGRDAKSSGLIVAAANAGLSDYAWESRARPAGVDPALQTTSRKARAAIASMLQDEQMAAHHLVPAEIWGDNIYVSNLALKAGWKVDAPSNLIALPTDVIAQAKLGGTLPMHRGGHPIYNKDTDRLISFARSLFPAKLTPMQARAILEGVALYNRIQILRKSYHPIIKAGR